MCGHLHSLTSCLLEEKETAKVCLHFIQLQDAVLFIKDLFPGGIHDDVFNLGKRKKLKNKIKIIHTHTERDLCPPPEVTSTSTDLDPHVFECYV